MEDKKSDVRYLSFKEGNIGIIGLGELLEVAKAKQFSDEKELARFLLEGVKQLNYVPSSCEEEYSEKLLREYKKYTGSLEDEDETGEQLEIRILGSGCPGCQKMVQETMAVLLEMGLLADFEYVGEPRRVRGYNITALPAILINRKVKSAGRILTKQEIKKLLSKELKKVD